MSERTRETALPPHEAGESLSLGYYKEVLLRRAPVVLLGVLAGLLAALAYLQFAPVSYTATTNVSLSVISMDPFDAQRAPSSLLDGATEAEIAQSYTVALAAAVDLGGELSASEIADGVDVSTVRDSTVMDIAFRARSQELARQGADAVAKAYLSDRRSRADQQLGELQDAISARVKDLRVALTAANKRADAARQGTSAANEARSDRDSLLAEINTLATRKNSLATVNTSGGYVVTPAAQHDVPRFPSRLLVLLTGLLVGLAAGAVAANWVNHRDRRPRTPVDVARATNATVLADIPGVVAEVPAGPLAVAGFRVARERVLAELHPRHSVLTVLDDTGGPEPSDVGINLAHALAQTRSPVLLVVPGMSSELKQAIARQLSLSRAGNDDDWFSQVLPGFRMYAPSSVEGPLDADPYVTTGVRQCIEMSADSLIVLVLPPSAGESSWAAAGRLSDAFIMVAALGASDTGVMKQRITAMNSVYAQLLGAITISPGRRLLASASKAESGWKWKG